MLLDLIDKSPTRAVETYILACKSGSAALRSLAMSQLWNLARVDQDIAMNLAIEGSSDGDEIVRGHAFRAWMSIAALVASQDK